MEIILLILGIAAIVIVVLGGLIAVIGELNRVDSGKETKSIEQLEEELKLPGTEHYDPDYVWNKKSPGTLDDKPWQ